MPGFFASSPNTATKVSNFSLITIDDNVPNPLFFTDSVVVNDIFAVKGTVVINWNAAYGSFSLGANLPVGTSTVSFGAGTVTIVGGASQVSADLALLTFTPSAVGIGR